MLLPFMGRNDHWLWWILPLGGEGSYPGGGRLLVLPGQFSFNGELGEIRGWISGPFVPDQSHRSVSRFHLAGHDDPGHLCWKCDRQSIKSIQHGRNNRLQQSTGRQLSGQVLTHWLCWKSQSIRSIFLIGWLMEVEMAAKSLNSFADYRNDWID